jgi:hypothetical protein
MPKLLPQKVKDCIEKSRSAAIAAVDAYNRPGPRFRTAQFIVLITIAWSALFHAIFYRQGRRPWYRRKGSGSGTGIRYVKIDGEPRHWDLTKCLKEYYGDKNPPERKNLEFLIGLRNKIEHRNLPQLDPALYGECQAALLNLEGVLVAKFGHEYALAEQLAISLQFTQLIPDQKAKAVRATASAAAKTVTEYVEKFRAGLPAPTLKSMKYSFTVFLVPRVANRESAADVAVQFIPVNEASEQELDRLEKLNVLIREKTIPISNVGMFKPGEVVREIAPRLPWRITMFTHTSAWKHYGVRPPCDDAHPQRTTAQYCVWDEVHRDYVYTPAWVDKLVRDLADPEEYERVVGRPPIPKREPVEVKPRGILALHHESAASTHSRGQEALPAPGRGHR